MTTDHKRKRPTMNEPYDPIAASEDDSPYANFCRARQRSDKHLFDARVKHFEQCFQEAEANGYMIIWDGAWGKGSGDEFDIPAVDELTSRHAKDYMFSKQHTMSKLEFDGFFLHSGQFLLKWVRREK